MLVGILLTAAGMGLALPAASLALTADAPPHQRGIAGALFASGQQVGSAIGIAVLATIAAAGTDTTVDLISGYRLSFLVATGLIVFAGIAIAIPRTRKRPEGPSRAGVNSSVSVIAGCRGRSLDALSAAVIPDRSSRRVASDRDR